MAHLVTGHAGIEHIKPSDDGAFNIGIMGSGQYVFPIGEQFGYEIIDNNLIKIKSGELVNQGRHINIPVNAYEEVIIENGLHGVNRHDLIVMRYERNPDTSIESASLVVLKGTSSANPSDPQITEGNIYEGANVSDFPLYRVRLDGLNIVGVDCLFDVIPSIESVHKDVAAIKTNLDKNGTQTLATVLASDIDSSTKTAIASITVPEDGNYAISLGVRWTGNGNGLRKLLLYGEETPYYDLSAYQNSNTTTAMDSYGFVQQYYIIRRCSKGEKMYMWAWQNSGANLALAMQELTLIRIG